MKNPISNATKDRFRAVYHDGSDRIVTTSASEVNRLLAAAVADVWDGPLNYATHDRLVNGAWVIIDEVRC